MPRRGKGARLWLRKAQHDRSGKLTHAAVWLIKDTARARDAALKMVEGLKEPSRTTSRESTLPKRKAGSAHRLRSRSGMS
jgi:hypothetical protein